MNWSNVKLILHREVRDQLRDRRTLFMIAVLPMLLYPLLGLSFLQVAQFVREHATRILILGADEVPRDPPLLLEEPINGAATAPRRFHPKLFSGPEQAKLLDLELMPLPTDEDPAEFAKRLIADGVYDAVVEFPDGFSEQLHQFRASLVAPSNSDAPRAVIKVPKPLLRYDASKEKSQMAYSRVGDVITRWSEAIGQQNLQDSRVPATAAKPFEFQREDIAEPTRTAAAPWSKILPFVLLIWALTGAFYPAIDLCAGEKERGTLETLLSSPAERSEIVTGKLLTIMLFSMATSVLNLVSMGITGLFVIKQFEGLGTGAVAKLGLPMIESPVWLMITLLPISALFSALCLALAAFARSTKEGQYYLMPLLLVTMPLMVLPMAPGVELTLGNSLIPVTGVVLLLRKLLEGDYVEALRFALPVVMVTLLCCLLAMRWAVDQFNKESVLFRESERLDLRLWLRHVVRDRGDTPTVGNAAFCAILILVLGFFINLMITSYGETWNDFAKLIAIRQIATVATPALIMAVMLTNNPLKTLLLRRPPLASIPAALVLAIALHPFVSLLSALIQQLYPMSPQTLESVKQITALLAKAPSVWAQILVIAVIPAVIEELAFRGFILSGFRHLGHKWRAIVLSSVFFGVTHMMIQQSLSATLMGVVIGFIAVQTGSLWPAMLFHVTNNSLALVSTTLVREAVDRGPIGELFFAISDQDEITYKPAALVVCGVVSLMILYWFAKRDYVRSSEERLQEAIDHQSMIPMAEPELPPQG